MAIDSALHNQDRHIWFESGAIFRSGQPTKVTLPGLAIDLKTALAKHVQPHLARLYRQTGRFAEAEAEENSLRAQLKLADPVHDIARALRQLPRTTESAARH